MQEDRRAGLHPEAIDSLAIDFRARDQQVDASRNVLRTHAHQRLTHQQSGHGAVVVAEESIDFPGLLVIGQGTGFARAAGVNRQHDEASTDQLFDFSTRPCAGRFAVSVHINDRRVAAFTARDKQQCGR